MSRTYVDSIGRTYALRDPVERFWSKVERTDTCWLWLGYVDTTTGYGKFSVRRRMIGAHRFAYELANGPIPDGLVLDHLCRVRHCVRPDHLEAVTNAVNIRRGSGWSGRNARVTECPQGHPYDEANTGRRPNGSRYCRTCNRLRALHRSAS